MDAHPSAHVAAYLQGLVAASSGVGLELEGHSDAWSGLMEALQRDGLQIVQEAATTLETQHLRQLSEAEASPGDSTFITDLVMSIICVVFAGFASGLTQGLLSLDHMEMKIKATSGTPKEKEYAAKVLPIISHHHLLLVTLMLWNASATEALPIFLSGLVSEYVAIIISVTMVLMFGEIIPASLLTGPKQLQIAASLIPLVYVVFTVFFPIAYPVAKLLDYIIGHDEGMTMYSRREIATMMKLQHEEGIKRASMADAGGSLSLHDRMQNDEVAIIGGALKYRDMRVSEVMTMERDCYMISLKESLSFKTMYEIFKSGYSRIPVYDRDRDDVVGLILAKDLIFVDPEDDIPIENFIALFGRKPMIVWHDQLLGETLTAFREERAHMAVVRDVRSDGAGDPVYVVVGIITLEDIIEEILGAEFEDETDATAYGRNSTATTPLRDMDLARFKALRSKITDEALSEDEVTAITAFLAQQVPEFQQLAAFETSGGMAAVAAAAKTGQLTTPTHSGHPEEELLLGVHRDLEVRTLEHSLPDKMGQEIRDESAVSGNTDHPRDPDTHAVLEGIVRKALVHNMRRKSPPDADKPHQDDILYRRGKLSNSCILILQGRVKVLRGQYEDEMVLGAWSTLGAQALIVPEGTYVPDFTAFVDSEMLRFIRVSTFHIPSYGVQRELLSTFEKKKHRRHKASVYTTGDTEPEPATPGKNDRGILSLLTSSLRKGNDKQEDSLKSSLLQSDQARESFVERSSLHSQGSLYSPPPEGGQSSEAITRKVTFHSK